MNEIAKTLKQMEKLLERLKWLDQLMKESDRKTFLNFCSIWYDHEHKVGTA